MCQVHSGVGQLGMIGYRGACKWLGGQHRACVAMVCGLGGCTKKDGGNLWFWTSIMGIVSMRLGCIDGSVLQWTGCCDTASQVGCGKGTVLGDLKLIEFIVLLVQELQYLMLACKAGLE